MKKNIFYTCVALLAFFYPIGLHSQTANICCPYIGWDYVMPITISNATGANIPAQSTLLVINTAAPIGAGKMQANGNDIRFVYNTCGNYINYWIESGINTATTNIWVAMPAIPNGSSINLFMYYGNAGAGAGAVAQTVLFPNIQTISGTQTLSGTITADWINVSGATINAPAGSPLVLQARKIVFNGTYNANYLGYGPQAGPGAGTNGGGGKGGSGGSYGGVGGSGGGSVSAIYGTANGADIDMGSGGGGSDCGPTAAGGGALSLIGSVVDVNGTINVRGQNAQSCCCGNSSEAAGGGSGGGVLISAEYVSGSAGIFAGGGNGGNSDDKEGGGGGAGGRVKVRWCQSNTFTGAVSVTGGSPGSGGQSGMQPGATGTYTQPQTTCYSVVMSAEQPVSIPTANFTYNNACTGVVTAFTSTTTLQSGGSVSSYAWDFGDGGTASTQNPTHSFTNTGSFNVQLSVTSSTGCTDDVSVTVNVQQLPVADFTATTVCSSAATDFTDGSTGGVVSWDWDFGDGNNAATQNPTHTYSNGGTYTVTLIANNSGNCADTVQKQVNVNNAPTANFSTSDVCFPHDVVFTDASTGTIATYAWSFGDGQTSLQQNPSHAYTTAGTYNVILIIQAANTCTDTATQSVTVYPKPTADFSVSGVCETETSVFTDASNGSVTAYTWSFGDGGTDAAQNPTHTYAAPGAYTATLIVSDANTCSDTLSKQAVVHPAPVADFATGAVCLNQSNSFSNTTTVLTGSIGSWLWDFGDAQSSTQQNPQHSYMAQGTYTVTLLAVSDNGCADSVSKPVNVFDKPTAAFTANEVCQGQSTMFTDGSSIGNGTIAQWDYQYGDGQSGTTAGGSHLYAAAGNFIARLVVSSNNGCTDTAQQNVTVHPLPVVAFTAADVCLGSAAVFSNTTAISTGTVANYLWNFGDGHTLTGQNATHTYNAAGAYPVMLIAASDKNCTDSVLHTVQVFDVPVAAATATEACYQQANGTATVSVTGGTAAYTYLWSNGQTATALTGLPAASYSVTVTDAKQCTATATASVNEPANALVANATPAAPSIVIGDQIQISLGNNYNDSNAVYSVSPDYALSCSNCAQFSAAPYQTTVYQVQVTDGKGCTGTGGFTVTVDQSIPVFIPNAFSPNGDGQNDTWGLYSQAVKQISIAVYNRWGEKVFESANQFELWDGTYQGRPAANGVYVYAGYIVYLNDVTKPVKGSVTIIR